MHMSKERREKLEEADSRKRKVGSRKKQSAYDMEISSHSSGDDEEEEEDRGRELPSGYRIRRVEDWPLSRGSPSGTSIARRRSHMNDKHGREKLVLRNLLSSSSPVTASNPPATPRGTRSGRSSGSDSASRWRRGSSLDRPSRPTEKMRDTSPDLPNADRSASNSSSESESNDDTGKRIKRKKRKSDVYEFRPVARKKLPQPRFINNLAEDSDVYIGSSFSRPSPQENGNDEAFFDDFDSNNEAFSTTPANKNAAFFNDVGHTGGNTDDDDELPDLPFFPTSEATASKAVQAKQTLDEALANSAGQNLSMNSVLLSVSSDLSKLSKLDTGDFPREDEEAAEETRKIQSPPSIDTDNASSEESHTVQNSTAPTSRQSALLDLDGTLDLEEVSGESTITDLGSSTTRKDPNDSLASDKFPQDSLAYRKKVSTTEARPELHRSTSLEQSDSQDAHDNQGEGRNTRSRSRRDQRSISPRAGASGPQTINRVSPNDACAPPLRPTSAVKATAQFAKHHPTALKRAISRLNTPALPDTDLSQTTQASVWPLYHQEGYGDASQSARPQTQLSYKERARLGNAPPSRYFESMTEQKEKDTTVLNPEGLSLDDPDSDGTVGDDEREQDEPDNAEGIEGDATTPIRERAPLPELEEQPPKRRRSSAGVKGVRPAKLLGTASLPIVRRQSALPKLKSRSQSVRSTTGLETQSQIEKALYDADSLVIAETKSRRIEPSTRDSSLLESSRSSSSRRPASPPRSTRGPILPSSLLPRLVPIDQHPAVGLIGKRPSETANATIHSKTVPSHGRVSINVLHINASNVIEISSGEEDESEMHGDDDIIFVKEERFDGPATPPTNRLQSQAGGDGEPVSQTPQPAANVAHENL